ASAAVRLKSIPARSTPHLTYLTYLTCLTLLSLTSCAYHLGPTNGLRPGERSIQVNSFVNQTIEPRLSDAINHSLRNSLQKDGTYSLDTHNEGDIIVSGAIVKYDRIQLQLQSTDTLTPTQYQLIITAQVTARERLSGKVLLNRRVSGQSTLFVG